MSRIDIQTGFDADREQAELAAYLGESYRHELLQQYELTLQRELDGFEGTEADFYRRSCGYLYNLTAFAMTGTKLPYLAELTRLVEPGARILDYGCGIGSDGLLLLEAGYRVEFADFANPSLAYLRWRLERRGLDAPIHDLDLDVPAGFDAAFAFDVIEHVEDPLAFLAELEARAGLIVVNLLEPEPGETALHHELPIGRIGARAAAMGLASYTILHGRSHLVAYSPGSQGPVARLRSKALIAAARAGRRPGRWRGVR